LRVLKRVVEHFSGFEQQRLIAEIYRESSEYFDLTIELAQLNKIIYL
jgi:hypothetical protein